LFRFKSTGIIYAVFKSAGKTRWKNLGTDDVRQAREMLGEEIQREAKVDWKRARSINLRDLIEHYESNPMNLAPSTLRTRTLLLKVFKETWPYGLTMKVHDVKSFMLRLWLAERRNARNLKSAGMNNYLRTLHGLFGLAVELGAVSENIALEIKLLREPNPDRLTPTWEQAQTIIEAVKRPRSKLALTAMLLLGIGQGELKNLRGEHFNLEQNTITIRRQKTQKVFTIPIFPQARSFVEKLRDDGRLEHGKNVFDMCNPREALVITCERLNLSLFTPRSFRRAFIIRALEKGIDPRVVAAWQGHRDATLILRVYGAWVNNDHAQRMASLMT
jgi:integrase